MTDPIIITYAILGSIALKGMPLLVRTIPTFRKNNAREELDVGSFQLEDNSYVVKTIFESKGTFKLFEYNLFKDQPTMLANIGRIKGYTFSNMAYIRSLYSFKENASSKEELSNSFFRFRKEVEKDLSSKGIKKSYFDTYVGLISRLTEHGYHVVNPLLRKSLTNKGFLYHFLPKTDFPTFLMKKNI